MSGFSLSGFSLSGFSVGGGISAAGKINHVTKAISRLPEQLKRSSVIIALITALNGPITELEDVFFSLLALKSIDDATGTTLDLIGALVGQSRGGNVDAIYRSFIRVRTAVNRSRGLPSDYVRIVSLLYPTAAIEVRPQGATAEVTVHGVVISSSDAALLLTFLQGAHGAGVRVVLGTYPQSEATTFSYRSATHLKVSTAIGATFLIALTVNDLRAFPPIGFLVIDAEVRAYTTDYAGTFHVLTACAAAHTAGAIITLCNASGTELNTGRGYNTGFYASGLTTTD